MRVDKDKWRVIVENVPIVSVDLVVTDPRESRFVLGLRNSNVAKDTWFVPGGRIYKNESLRDAVDRVAEEEAGVEVDVVRELGTYQHFYDESDIGTDSGKHYVANAYLVYTENSSLESDSQHSELKWFDDLLKVYIPTRANI